MLLTTLSENSKNLYFYHRWRDTLSDNSSKNINICVISNLMTFFTMQNTQEDILKNVGNRMVPVALI